MRGVYHAHFGDRDSKGGQGVPAVVPTGPRQSGKTTLLQRLFAEKYRYVCFEQPDVRAAASSDPRGFLRMHRPPVIFDEVQYAPDLFPHIKEAVDAARNKPGQYLLTGSRGLLLMERVTEWFAGRAAMLGLLLLSRREEERRPQAVSSWEVKGLGVARSSVTHQKSWKRFLRGNYPELVAHPERDLVLWHSSYVQTYLERDARTLRNAGDLTQFQNFLRALLESNPPEITGWVATEIRPGESLNSPTFLGSDIQSLPHASENPKFPDLREELNRKGDVPNSRRTKTIRFTREHSSREGRIVFLRFFAAPMGATLL